MIKETVKKLDQLAAQGNIMDAFETYFAENVITHSDAGDRSESKVQKREFLNGFFSNIAKTEEIKFHESLVDGMISYSKFTFIFINKQGEQLKWHEIIRRTWENNLVVDEYYFQGSFKDLKKEIEAKAEKPKVKKTEKKVTKVEKTPKAPKTNAAKTPKKDDLKLVEGIGPKIEQLLHLEGIETYIQLSKTSIKKLEKILEAAGPRFRMHSPNTWPFQGKLLAEGKLDELKKLQDDLKGGKEV